MTLDASHQKWHIAGIAAAILAVIMGQLVNGLSSFFTVLETAHGWSRGDIALINTAGLLGLALGGIVMGVLADRLGVRHVAMMGVLVSALCFALAAFAQSLWQLYAIFFLAGLMGGGAVFGPLIALVGRWFSTGAGLAIGLVAAGQAIGQGGVPFLNVILIDAFGWRGALLVFGGLTAALLPFAMMLTAPPKAGLASAAVEAPHALPLTPVLVIMSAAVFFCCALMSVPLMHLLPLLEACGIPASDAGGVVFIMMLAAIAGRVAFGKLADMIGPVQAWLLASAWQTALVFLFTGIEALPLFLLFAPIYGFGYAGVMTGVLASLKALTPVSRRASATGIVLAFAWAGHGFGGYAGGALFDRTLDYTASFGFAAGAGLVNLLLVAGLLWALMGPRPTPVYRAAN